MIGSSRIALPTGPASRREGGSEAPTQFASASSRVEATMAQISKKNDSRTSTSTPAGSRPAVGIAVHSGPADKGKGSAAPAAGKGSTPAASPAHVDVRPTIAPGASAAPAAPSAPPTAAPTSVEPAAEGKKAHGKPPASIRDRIAKSASKVATRCANLQKWYKRWPVEVIRPLALAETHAREVLNELLKLPADFRPARPEHKVAAEILLTVGTKVQPRDRYAADYEGLVAKEGTDVVELRKSLIVVLDVNGQRFGVPRAHFRLASTAPAAQPAQGPAVQASA